MTRIGHACQLIEIGGTRVLTDPWFTQTATYYHGEPVASTVETLGRIDAVLVSHEHYDHCDLDALAREGFDPGVPLIGPGTVAAIARDKGFSDVRAIEAWEATTTGDLTVTATIPGAGRPRWPRLCVISCHRCRNDSNGPTLLLAGHAELPQRSHAVVPTTATVQRCRSGRGPNDSKGPTPLFPPQGSGSAQRTCRWPPTRVRHSRRSLLGPEALTGTRTLLDSGALELFT